MVGPRCSYAALILLAAVPSLARGELRVTQPTVDLGQVRAGRYIEQRFEFVNEGPSSIELMEAKASCGCLSPALDKRTFQDGDHGVIPVKVNTLSVSPGPHSWRVQLQYRAGGTVRETTLLIRAHVIQEIMVQPPSMIIYSDGPVQHQLLLVDLRPESFSITRLETSSAHLSAKLAEEYHDSAGRSVRKITLHLDSGYPTGRKDEELTIHTDDPNYREIRVPVTVSKRAKERYSALPASVAMVVSAGEPSPSRLITIRDSQRKPVTIERVESGHPAIQCQWAEGAHMAATLKITIESSQLPSGALDSQIQVFFSVEESLIIPVSCTAR